MGRRVVPVAGGAVDARHGLLVIQQQAFVGGEEVGLAELRRRFRRQPAGGHEGKRLVQPVGQVPVALAERAVGDESQVPLVHLLQIRVPALGEGAQQIERRRRLVVALHQAVGVRPARLGRELHAVDVVAAVTGQGHAVPGLGVGRAGLGELARHAPDLDHRAGGAEGQHHRHLQQNAEGVADIVGVEFGEALGAVAALEQKRLTVRRLGEPRLQAPRLAGEDQRRVAPQLLFHPVQRVAVRVLRNLFDGLAAPGIRRPSLGHGKPFHHHQSGVRTITPIRPNSSLFHQKYGKSAPRGRGPRPTRPAPAPAPSRASARTLRRSSGGCRWWRRTGPSWRRISGPRRCPG